MSMTRMSVSSQTDLHVKKKQKNLLYFLVQSFKTFAPEQISKSSKQTEASNYCVPAIIIAANI